MDISRPACHVSRGRLDRLHNFNNHAWKLNPICETSLTFKQIRLKHKKNSDFQPRDPRAWRRSTPTASPSLSLTWCVKLSHSIFGLCLTLYVIYAIEEGRKVLHILLCRFDNDPLLDAPEEKLPPVVKNVGERWQEGDCWAHTGSTEVHVPIEGKNIGTFFYERRIVINID